jgi:hypothetical protein
LPIDRANAVRERVEWGMRTVHEIQHRGPLDKLLEEFGYGTDRVRVHNYWDESPVLTLSRPDVVAWLALSAPASKNLMVVLASWSAEDVTVELSPSAQALGLPVDCMQVIDAESGQPVLRAASGKTAVELAGPYGVRIVRWRGE